MTSNISILVKSEVMGMNITKLLIKKYYHTEVKNGRSRINTHLIVRLVILKKVIDMDDK